MKNKRKILIAILLITICAGGYVFIKITNPTIKGVIIKVNDKNLTFMDIKDEGVYNISIPENNAIQFKKDQEILVKYKYNTIIEQSFPANIKTKDIENITILKEKSNV